METRASRNLVAEVSQETGDEITISRFERYGLGELVEEA
jgi:hypothetical protein